jgi:hypothetical protein
MVAMTTPPGSDGDPPARDDAVSRFGDSSLSFTSPEQVPTAGYGPPPPAPLQREGGVYRHALSRRYRVAAPVVLLILLIAAVLLVIYLH